MKKMKLLPLLVLMIGLIACTAQAQQIKLQNANKHKTADTSITDGSSASPLIPAKISSKQSGKISLVHKTQSNNSPRQTDDEVIRYDDGVNHDAIGGGDFLYAATYWPASTMGQYTGMKLIEVEVYISDAAIQFTLRICGQGTATSPGAIIHEQIAEVNPHSWNSIALSQAVDINGDDLWIGYKITYDVEDYSAGCDDGPAVAGYGDMISATGTIYESMSNLGLNYNWNIAATLTGQDDPEVAWNPGEFFFEYWPNAMETQELEVSNIGGGIVECSMSITYGSSAPPSMPSNASTSQSGQISLAHKTKTMHSPQQTDDEVIRYDDGLNYDAIAANDYLIVAAYWPSSAMAQYIGMKLSEVEVYIHDSATLFTLRIYGQGTATIPGAILYEQIADVNPYSWNTIMLSQEVEISGNDLWIAYEVHHYLGDFAAGCDAGPAVAGFGDMISLDGISYEPLSGLGLNYNWNIAATLTGEPVLEWVSIYPSSASIPAGQSVVFDVTADFSNFLDNTNDYFYGTIWMATNDPLNPLVEIPFMAMQSSIDENNTVNSFVMVYPNPGKDFVNISSGYTMHKASICNQAGQLVLEKQLSGKSTKLNTGKLQTGLYYLTVDSEAGTSTLKLVIK